MRHKSDKGYFWYWYAMGVAVCLVVLPWVFYGFCTYLVWVFGL